MVLGLLLALLLWPANDPEVIDHSHPELPAEHPHRLEHEGTSQHAHPFVIDGLHPRWPRSNYW